MKSIVFAVKDMFKHYLNWHGRLSRAGYWWGWLGIAIISVILQFLGESVNDIFSTVLWVWGVVTFLPLLFATMRRYHDSGKPGWLAILFCALGNILVVLSLALFLGSLFAAYFATGDDGGMLLALLSSAGIFAILALVLSILNFVFLVLPGTPGENAYGVPRPFDPNEGENKGYKEIPENDGTEM